MAKKNHRPVQGAAVPHCSASTAPRVPYEAVTARAAAVSGTHDAPAEAGAPHDSMLSLQQELQTLRAENAALRQQLQQLQSERIKSPATDAASSHQLERMLGEVLRLQRESAPQPWASPATPMPWPQSTPRSSCR